MAEHGIKLFGQTIILQVKKEDPTSQNDKKTLENSNNNPKRPDKIIACPRCKSMETKFCYFNNYNVNQPRHFCKGCQRYWTAGGALRNVPVGAGRRKSKSPGQAFELGENFLLDGLNMDMNGMEVDQWRLAAAVAATGGFRHGFQVKRRRNEFESHGQTC